MIYEYRCFLCDEITDVIKPVRDIDKVERCTDCGTVMIRQFTIPQISTPQVEAHYQPAFGKVVKSRREIKEEIHRMNAEKGMDIVEVGESKHTSKVPEPKDTTDYHQVYAELKKLRGKNGRR